MSSQWVSICLMTPVLLELAQLRNLRSEGTGHMKTKKAAGGGQGAGEAQKK